jgi:hypothetical protein
MADTTDNLVLDHLRALRADTADVKSAIQDLRDGQIGIRAQLHALQGDLLRQERTLAAVQVDLDRIKARVDLVDAHS